MSSMMELDSVILKKLIDSEQTDREETTGVLQIIIELLCSSGEQIRVN